MTPAVLTLECAKKIREVLGETYETENYWDVFCEHIYPCGPKDHEPKICNESDFYKDGSEIYFYERSKEAVPLPDFAETIRLLPHIGEAKKDSADSNGWIYRPEVYAGILAEIFMLAPTPEQGMIEISEYILKII